MVQNDLNKYGIKISSQREDTVNDNITTPNCYGLVLSISPKEYIFQLLPKVLAKQLPNVKIFSNFNGNWLLNGKSLPIFNYGDYEQLDMNKFSMDHKPYFTNSYIYRKTLIRKHYLSHIIHYYIVKSWE